MAADGYLFLFVAFSIKAELLRTFNSSTSKLTEMKPNQKNNVSMEKITRCYWIIVSLPKSFYLSTICIAWPQKKVMPELKMSSVSFILLCCFTRQKFKCVLGVGGKHWQQVAGVAFEGRDQGLLCDGCTQLQPALK